MTIGERIKKRRIELGMTQDDLADKAGYYGKSAISRYEKLEDDDFTMKQLIRFAAALGVSVAYLMGEENIEDIIGVSSHQAGYIQISDITKALQIFDKYQSLSKEVRAAVDVLLGINS